MIYRFDLAGDAFQHLDFRDGILAFNPTTIGGPSFSMLAWGTVCNQWAALHLFGPNGDHLPPSVRSQFPCPLYFSRWGKVTFQGVRKMAMRLTPIAPSLEKETQFLKKDGRHVVVEKAWEIGDSLVATDGNGCGEIWYEIGAYLERPYGDLYLSVLASGPVAFEVELDGSVPYAHYLADAARYDFDAFRDRQAREFPTHTDPSVVPAVSTCDA